MAHRNGRRTCAVCKGTGRKPASAGKTNWWVRYPHLNNELGQLVCLVAGERKITLKSTGLTVQDYSDLDCQKIKLAKSSC
uniref:Uncharacterized protein n=1 Tax=Mus spicilegus TaxID=10103 RepID=A0A8C6MXA3_MUSSI